MITGIEILGTEEILLQRNPSAAVVHQAIVNAGCAAVIALDARYRDPSDDMDLDRLGTECDAVVERSLEEYARQASGLFTAEDLDLWTAKITRVPGSYVARAAAVGVPGAFS